MPQWKRTLKEQIYRVELLLMTVLLFKIHKHQDQ